MEESREFLTHAEIAVPDRLRGEQLDRLLDAEHERAAQLAASGELIRAWRTPGRWGNWCLWREPDAAALDAALRSLPLHPYMTVAVHPLDPHPNDPG